MLTEVISTSPKSALFSLSVLKLGESGEFEVVAPEIKDRFQFSEDLKIPEATKYNYQVQESVFQGASQDNEVAHAKGLVGWFRRLKRVIGILENKHVSYSEKAKNVKPRRRGMYTFLYGGRVDVHTFYD
ncbi:hypothetical protein C0992_005919 [Termitomyces sp. T32_za158]|nr:hypothetical protein C0992_005919 [Termitomyces sp. T32_za158]